MNESVSDIISAMNGKFGGDSCEASVIPRAGPLA